MSKEVMEFIVYMIHACSKKWGKSPSVVYQILRDKKCIDGYLIPHYEVLHTQSTLCVVEDIEKYIGVNRD